MRASDVFDAARAGGWVPLYDQDADPVYALARRYDRFYRWLERSVWTLAFVLDIADLVTTYLGVPHPNVAEAAPASRWMLNHFSWPGLILEHIVVFLFLIVLWLGLPRPYRIVVPGVAVWTSYIIARQNLTKLMVHGLLDLPW